MKPLHEAAKNGELAKVKELIEKGADVNEDDGEYGTPLHCAAKEGKVDVIEYLVSCGAHVDATNKEGSTPLHYAAIAASSTGITSHLHRYRDNLIMSFDQNCMPNIKETDREKSFRAMKHMLYMVRQILGHKPILVLYGDSKASIAIGMWFAFKLKEAGFNKLKRVIFYNQPVRKGSLLTEKDIRRYGTKIESYEDGKSYLNLDQAQQELVDSFIKHLLEQIVKNPQNEMTIQYLIEKCGADAKARDNNGATPLHYAASTGNIYAIQYLIEKCGVGVTVSDKNGNTPLHEAAKEIFYDTKSIQLLVELGADLHVLDSHSRKPIDVASTDKKKNLLQKLMDEHEAKIKRKQEQSQKEILFAPMELVNNVQKALNNVNEKLGKANEDKQKLQQQLELLLNAQKNQNNVKDNSKEIEEIQTKLDANTKDLSMLQPQIDLAKAQKETLDSLAQNKSAIEFYNTTHAFLKIFFNGMSAAHCSSIAKNGASGILNTIGGIFGKASSLASIIPYGDKVCGLIEEWFKGKQLDILKNRIRSLADLSEHPSLPLMLEKIASELTHRHQDSFLHIHETPMQDGLMKQLHEFQKKGNFTLAQELAVFVVAGMIDDMLNGAEVFIVDIKERCLATTQQKTTSRIKSVKQDIKTAFSQEIVFVKATNHSIPEKCHYRDFFIRSGIRVGERYFSNEQTWHKLLGYRVGTMEEVNKLQLKEERRSAQNNNNNNNATNQTAPAIKQSPKIQDVTFTAKSNAAVALLTTDLELQMIKQKTERVHELENTIHELKENSKKDSEESKKLIADLINELKASQAEIENLKVELQQKASTHEVEETKFRVETMAHKIVRVEKKLEEKPTEEDPNHDIEVRNGTQVYTQARVAASLNASRYGKQGMFPGNSESVFETFTEIARLTVQTAERLESHENQFSDVIIENQYLKNQLRDVQKQLQYQTELNAKAESRMEHLAFKLESIEEQQHSLIEKDKPENTPRCFGRGCSIV